MTNKELLKQKLETAKADLEEKGYTLGGEEPFMFQFPAMKQYEFAFQAAIEDVWPDEAWWQRTDYWDIFQESIMAGKTADEVIQDILDHITDDVEEIKTSEEEVVDEVPSEEENIQEGCLKEECEGCKVSDSIFDLMKGLDEGE